MLNICELNQFGEQKPTLSTIIENVGFCEF